MPTSWPLHVTALPGAACGVVRWRSAGKHWVTVFVKTTFELVNGGVAKLIAPLDLATEDRHRAPSGCLDEAAETAPYLPSAGVILGGHAYAPGGRPTTSAAVRLALMREQPLLDKTLHIFGDRAPGAASGQPFSSMPLIYERAFGGPGNAENPIGNAAPNVVDPADPRRVAGFGPIARHWPVRARLLGRLDPRALDAADVEIPESIDWRWFHAAPLDQQIGLLRGDEWITLDGMHATLSRVQTRLPSAVARAQWRLRGRDGAEMQTVELHADTLIIDADRLIASVISRGRFELARADDAHIVAGVELPGLPIAWPSSTTRPGAIGSGVVPAFAPPPSQRPSSAPMAPIAPTFGRPPASAHWIEPVVKMAPAPARRDPLMGTIDAVSSPFHVALPFAPIASATPAVARADHDDLAATIAAAVSPFHQLAAVASVEPARPAPGIPAEDPPMETVAVKVGSIRQALPFAPGDPSKPPPAAVIRNGPPPVIRRPDQSLTGTGQAAISPFAQMVTPFDPRPPPPMIAPPAPFFAPPPAMEPPRIAAPPAPIFEAPAAVLVAAPAAPIVAPPIVAPPTTPTVALPATPAAPPPPSAASPIVADLPSAGLRDKVLDRLLEKQPLHGLSLVGADLREIDFQGVSLARLDLRRANLQRANLRGVDATEIQLESADLSEASLEGADFTRGNLARAVLTRARFDGATLVEANLQRATGDAASFRNARLAGVDLRQARLQGSAFDGANLRGASAMKVDLSGSRFVRADLEGSNLRDSKLREANFSRANLEGADLRDADLARANVHGASRKTTKLMPAQLKGLVETEPERDPTSGQ